jgi:hypothetical protein
MLTTPPEARRTRDAAGSHDLKLVDHFLAVVSAVRSAASSLPTHRRHETVVEISLAGDRDALSGNGDVSAKRWLLPVLVGETPGISSARSR